MDNWHYNRRELAEHYLNIFKIGISKRLALFAPRRKGKTSFLLFDLSPLAQENGYIPIYTSLWTEPNCPHTAIIKDLQAALAKIAKKGTFKTILTSKIQKFSYGNDFLGKGEIEFASDPVKPNSKDLLLIDELFDQLIKAAKNKKILLLIDEIQHLSSSAVFEPIIYSLRTAIDKRSDQLYVIFTGSSRHGLTMLFNKKDSALYQFVEQVDFPDLDIKFLQHITNYLKSEFDLTLDMTELESAFHQVDYSPFWLMKIVQRIILKQSSSLKDSLNYVVDLIEETEDYQGITNKLKPLDKEVYLLIAAKKPLYSEETLKLLKKKMGKNLSAPTIQRSLQRIVELHLASKGDRGEYLIEKPGFTNFLLDQTSS